MSDFNETYADAINSNSEERTSSMSDYSTSTTPDETQYQENTPTVTPEIVDAGTDDANLIDTNPVAASGRELPKRIIWTSSCSG